MRKVYSPSQFFSKKGAIKSIHFWSIDNLCIEFCLFVWHSLDQKVSKYNFQNVTVTVWHVVNFSFSKEKDFNLFEFKKEFEVTDKELADFPLEAYERMPIELTSKDEEALDYVAKVVATEMQGVQPDLGKNHLI